MQLIIWRRQTSLFTTKGKNCYPFLTKRVTKTTSVLSSCLRYLVVIRWFVNGCQVSFSRYWKRPVFKFSLSQMSLILAHKIWFKELRSHPRSVYLKFWIKPPDKNRFYFGIIAISLILCSVESGIFAGEQYQ